MNRLAVLQGKCTSVLVEMEKTAHSQSNAVSFAVTIFLSGLTGSELCLFKNLTQSGEDRQICSSVNFLFLLYRRSRVFLWVSTTAHIAHIYSMSVTR